MAPEGSRYAVISADAHDEPPERPDRLLAYVDAAHRGAFQAWLDANPPQPGTIKYGRDAKDYSEGVAALFKGGFDPTPPAWVDKASAWSRYPEQPDMTDPVARVAQVESMGVVGEVVNPSSSLWFQTAFADDRDMLDACRWAYLRWFADYCGAVPGRLAGTIPIEGSCRSAAPVGHDLPGVLAQVRWAREHGLFGGVQIPSPAYDVPEVFDPYWEPLWALCSELELPLILHGGCHGRLNVAPSGSLGPRDLAIAIFEASFASKRNFWHLMIAGVLDRYPNLKLVFIEQHVTSIVGILAEHDHIVSTKAPNAGAFGTLKDLKMLPSEYWQTHCLLGPPFLRPDEVVFMRDSFLGLRTMAWGSDYPHTEGVYPDFTRALRYAFGGLPEAELRPILGGRVAEAFGFDLAALQTIADRCGPAVEDLASPLPTNEIPRFTFSGAYEVDYTAV